LVLRCCISVFCVNCWRLQILDCQKYEGGDSNLKRKLIIKCRSALKDMLTEFKVFQFCLEHGEYVTQLIIVDNVTTHFLPI
jgi:hypothetical protein